MFSFKRMENVAVIFSASLAELVYVEKCEEEGIWWELSGSSCGLFKLHSKDISFFLCVQPLKSFYVLVLRSCLVLLYKLIKALLFF